MAHHTVRAAVTGTFAGNEVGTAMWTLERCCHLFPIHKHNAVRVALVLRVRVIINELAGDEDVDGHYATSDLNPASTASMGAIVTGSATNPPPTTSGRRSGGGASGYQRLNADR